MTTYLLDTVSRVTRNDIRKEVCKVFTVTVDIDFLNFVVAHAIVKVNFAINFLLLSSGMPSRQVATIMSSSRSTDSSSFFVPLVGSQLDC